MPEGSFGSDTLHTRQPLVRASRQCSLPLRAHWLVLMAPHKSPWAKAAAETETVGNVG